MNRHLVPRLLFLAAMACGPRETPFPQRPALNKSAGVTAADLAGCYGLEIGRWSPAAELPVQAELELTLDYVRRSPGAHAPVRPGWAAEYVVRQRGSENKGMWSLWRPSDARIIWNNGDIATEAELTVDRKSRNLTGTVRTVNAAQPQQSGARIRLIRKPC